MNYQLSLDAGGNPPSLDSGDEDGDEFAKLRGLADSSVSVSDEML